MTEQSADTVAPDPGLVDDYLDLMAANERMGAALTFIYREAPEWKQRVADYLADYPFEWEPK